MAVSRTKKRPRLPAASARKTSDGLLTALRSLNSPAGASESDDTSDGLAADLARDFPAGVDIDAFMLTIRLRRIAMRIDEALIKRGATLGIKLNELFLLFALRRAKGQSMRPTDILKIQSVTSGTVTYRIDQLTKQGLAERILDPADKRGYLIQLTPRGRAVIEEMVVGSSQAANEFLRPLFAVAGARETFVEMLRFYELRIDEDAS